MTDIDRIMYLIDWNRSPEDQMEGISLAREVVCLKAFFQPFGPGYGKSVWENCATIICARSDEELMLYITDMILWMEDLNWPGAVQIQQRLIAFQSVSSLAFALNAIVPALEQLKETSWLQFISDLLCNQKLSQTINQRTREILEQYSLNETSDEN